MRSDRLTKRQAEYIIEIMDCAHVADMFKIAEEMSDEDRAAALGELSWMAQEAMRLMRMRSPDIERPIAVICAVERRRVELDRKPSPILG